MADVTVDARGMMCPMPIVKLTKAVKKMEAGQTLELIADDPGAKEDVPAWSSRTGNGILESSEEGGTIRFLIEKGGD